MSSSSFQKLKETYSKSRRRQQIQKKLGQKRKKLTIQVLQQERQTFLELLPQVNLENYEQNRLALCSFARSPDYSYQMLPIAFISFEYLLVNPIDLSSWEILTNLSYYEDFQIPQTQKFAQIFTQLFKTHISLASQFLSNASSLQKCSLLCCRLVDEGILQIIGKNLQQNGEIYWRNSMQNANFPGKEDLEILIYNLLTILINIFMLKPMLEMEQMVKICELINYQARSNKFLKQVHDQTIFKLLQNVVSQFPSKRNVIQMLVFQFSETLSNSFFTYEEESLLFMALCVRNRVKVTEKLIQNLFVSIKSKNNKNKISALKLLQEILTTSDDKEKMQIQNPKQNNFQIQFFSSTLPSFAEFNLMFSTNNEAKKPKQYSNQEQINLVMTYSLLFNEDYEKNMRILMEMYENSSQGVQSQIAQLFKAIVKCLIRQVTSSQTKRALTYCNNKQHIVPDMQTMLSITIQMQQMYIFLNECLNSSNKQIILCALEILRDVISFSRQEQQIHQEQEMNGQSGFEILLNSIHKFNVYSSIQALTHQSNAKINQISQEVINFIDESR